MLVRGTQKEKPLELEFSQDTVYERKNIKRIEEKDEEGRQGFSGWEYDEVQYTYPEYVKIQEQRRQNESADIKLAIAELAEIVTGGE